MMKTIIPFGSSPTSSMTNAIPTKTSGSAVNWVDHLSNRRGGRYPAPMTLERTKRLIDAACTAFFTKRGLGRDGYAQSDLLSKSRMGLSSNS